MLFEVDKLAVDLNKFVVDEAGHVEELNLVDADVFADLFEHFVHLN